VSKPSKPPKSAFQLYCEEARPRLETKHADSDVNIDEELEKAWKDLPESEKDEYEIKLEQLQKAVSEKGDAETEAEADADISSPKKDGDKTLDAKVKDDDEDVEMGNYDTEEQEAQADKDAEKDDDKNGDD
jgi:non-histone protein 10